jgi:hypothetical protein
MRVRESFQKLFDAGYSAVDFVLDARLNQPRAAYILTRLPIDLGTP